MKVLNVAEINDAAKNLAGIMSRGNMIRKEGLSKFNKLYEFECTLFGQTCTMVMTSVAGHILKHEFAGVYRNWNSCNPLLLFEAPVIKCCPKDCVKIKDNLEREARNSDTLIIWTDCDSEGENIGFEIIQVCLEATPSLRVYRANFSEITSASVSRAINNLREPNRRISNAVDVRKELDLRIGAAFTRFQALCLKSKSPSTLQSSMISYGSKASQDLICERFWTIKVNHTLGDKSVDFRWKRVHLTDQEKCWELFELCEQSGVAKVQKVQSKPKNNQRPLPLNSVELIKLASKLLEIKANKTMKIAKKLYVQGFISFPRTETNIFPEELDLRGLVFEQVQDSKWGEFAAWVLEMGPNPRQGKKTDNAHPPIHPIKHAKQLSGNEKRLYELIVRHFLACCSKDAEGINTMVEISIANEKFSASGLAVITSNYLDVYPYKKWETKEMHNYTPGQNFEPTSVDVTEEETEQLLTEAKLIALLEKHGIGSNGTHADHRETTMTKDNAGLDNDANFMASQYLGMGLAEGYDDMRYSMSTSNLRAELEHDLKCISLGKKDPAAVLAEQIAKHKEVFQKAVEKASKFDKAFGKYLNGQTRPGVPSNNNTQDNGIFELPEVMPCKCRLPMIIREWKCGYFLNANVYFVSCLNFPECCNAMWLPGDVVHVEVAKDTCPRCGPHVHQINFKFKWRSLKPLYPDEYKGCLGGCDEKLLEFLNINAPNISTTSAQNSLTQTSNPATSTGKNQTEDSGSNFSQPATQGLINSQESCSAFINESTTATAPEFRSTSPDGCVPVSCLCGQNALKLTVRKVGPNTGRQFYKCGRILGNKCAFFLWVPSNDVNDSRDAAGSGGRDSGQRTWEKSSQKEREGKKEEKKSGRGGSSSWGVGGDWGSSSGMGGGSQGNEGRMAPPRNNQGSGSHKSTNPGKNSNVKCHCGQPGKRLVVRRQTANKGREFFACPNPRGEQCDFFKWADEKEGGPSIPSWSPTVPPVNRRGGSTWPYSNLGRHNGPRGMSMAEHYDPKRKRKCSLCKEEGHTRITCQLRNLYLEL